MMRISFPAVVLRPKVKWNEHFSLCLCAKVNPVNRVMAVCTCVFVGSSHTCCEQLLNHTHTHTKVFHHSVSSLFEFYYQTKWRFKGVGLTLPRILCGEWRVASRTFQCVRYSKIQPHKSDPILELKSLIAVRNVIKSNVQIGSVWRLSG